MINAVNSFTSSWSSSSSLSATVNELSSTAPVLASSVCCYRSPNLVLGERPTIHDAKILAELPEVADCENLQIYNDVAKVHRYFNRLCNEILLSMIVLTLLVGVNLKTMGEVVPVLVGHPCKFWWKCSAIVADIASLLQST